MITEFQLEREVNRTEMFHNGNGVEIEVIFHRRFNVKYGIIKILACQIKYIVILSYELYRKEK